MNPKSFLTLFIVIYPLLAAGAYSQTQLLQSFLEKNNTGSSEFGTVVASVGDVNNDSYDDAAVLAWAINQYGRVYIYYGGPTADTLADITFDGNENTGTMLNVCGVGDVNGDSYDDVAIGMWNYLSERGRVLIYFGGTVMDTLPDVTLTGESEGNCFGYSLAGAGDVNHDGYADLIVGAYGYNSNQGKMYIYFGGATMDATADLTAVGEPGYIRFGYSISSAGDVNNDNFDDIIVGTGTPHGYSGRAYVFFGGAVMNNVPDVVITGDYYDYFAHSVSNAGDLNNDGYDDFMVGAYNYNNAQGKVFVYFGGTTVDTTADVVLTGEPGSGQFGYSIACAGDVNNDSYTDIIVGAWAINLLRGRAYIFLGGSSMDSSPDVTMTGEFMNNYFGRSVTGACDFNADGYDDVIVGAAYFNNYQGRAYLYTGSPTPDNTADYIITGEGMLNSFGYSVAPLGDINNDGYDDIIIGAYGYDNGRGRAYIYFGGRPMNNFPDILLTGQNAGENFGSAVACAGDVNHDGYKDIIIGAPRYSSAKGRAYIFFGGPAMDNVADVTLTGESNSSLFGAAVACAGDVNGDSYDDVVVGAYYFNSAQGKAYVFLGGAAMDAIADLSMSGEATGNCFGFVVSAAGDINGDGYSDIIIGAPLYDSQRGRVYVFLGGNPMNNIADFLLDGETTNNRFGYALYGAGKFNNDTYDDFIVGAPNANNLTGRSYVFYGSPTLSNTPALILNGENVSDQFGFAVAGRGSVNADAYPDVIVSAPNGNGNRGQVNVYYGGAAPDAIADASCTGIAPGDKIGFALAFAGDVNSDGWSDILAGNYSIPQNGAAFLFTHSDAPLPVELTSFTALYDEFRVVLRWRTETEKNNAGFAVERAAAHLQHDNEPFPYRDWQEVGFIAGSGTTNHSREYCFVDKSISSANQLHYRLKQLDADGTFHYSKVKTVSINPNKMTLKQNYPNPFNQATVISYAIPAAPAGSSAANVLLEIYDVLGNRVCRLVNQKQPQGIYDSRFDAAQLSSGIYYCVLKVDNDYQLRKMALLK